MSIIRGDFRQFVPYATVSSLLAVACVYYAFST